MLDTESRWQGVEAPSDIPTLAIMDRRGRRTTLERYVEPPKGGVVRNVKPDPLDSQTDAEALNLEDTVRRGVALRGCGWMRSELRRVVAVNRKSQ